MADHVLEAGPETCRWGQVSAAFAPVLTVRSGETVTIRTVNGAPEWMPPAGSGMRVDPRLAAIHASVPRHPGHVVTGPVAIEGARPGDMLEVRIERVAVTQEWGYCGFRPLKGTLPKEFPDAFLRQIPVDRDAGTCALPYGPTLRLAPFFGVMGVAPAAALGTLSTIEPRAHGGNLDNKELIAGSTLFLPVFADGALFFAGDGHGLQGDGEVCINALEIDLEGDFRFVLHARPDGAEPLLARPRAETATHFVSMGMDEDLDEAMRIALREMIALIVSRSALSREEAYQFCSLAVDFRVTQTVNGEKGVHGMLARGLIGGL